VWFDETNPVLNRTVELESRSEGVGNVEAKVIGGSLAFSDAAAVEGLGKGHLPVLVQLVVKLDLGGGFLGELKTVSEGRILGEDILATTTDDEGLSEESEFSCLAGVVLGLVGVGEVLVSVANKATDTSSSLGGVVGQPVLVATILTDEGDSRLSDIRGVVLEGGTKVEVLLEVDVGIEVDLGGVEAGSNLLWLGSIFFGVNILEC
jgi:hypothetical protein